MFNHKYVPIKQIIDNIKRGRLYKEMPEETAIAYAVEAYRLLASEKAEITKPAKIEIQGRRGKIPADLERVVRTAKTDCDLKSLIPMRYATDDFHSVRHCLGSRDLSCRSEYTYSMNNNYIITNFEEGWVFMAYKSLPTDSDCNLVIPDNVNVQLAIQYYIRWRYLDDLGSDDPKIERQKEQDDQQYCWYIGKAQDAMTNMTMDEFESFANSLSKFFDAEDHYQTFMRDLGGQEYIRIQRYG